MLKKALLLSTVMVLPCISLAADPAGAGIIMNAAKEKVKEMPKEQVEDRVEENLDADPEVVAPDDEDAVGTEGEGDPGQEPGGTDEKGAEEE